MVRWKTFLFFVCMIVSVLWGQEKNGGSVHGLVVGDYFYKAGGDAQRFGDSSSQYSQPIPKDFQAFQLRRLHFFYDYILSEEFSTRFQLEGNNKSLEPGGRQGLYVKTAYGEWKNVFPQSSLLLGLVPTPTWSSVEGAWGYRSVEKTITDARNLGSGSDLGILLRGMLPLALPLQYALMMGNGNAQKPENNKYKKYYAAFSGRFFQNILLEGYVDYEPAAGNKDRTTWKTFLAYQEPSFMIGAEVMEQVQKNQDSLFVDIIPWGISFFSWYRCSDQCRMYGRIDYYNPNRLAPSAGFYEYFISLGLDYMPANNIHFMPNVWINTFTDKSGMGRTKTADVVPRLTFFFAFN